jgi:MFS transporter, PPP family, 3-phenylpropionic acid transporter
MAVRLLQAAALAPLVPLADALSLAHARPRQNTGGFEYGWVRGVGSAAFVAGTLLAGQAAGDYGLSAIIWLSATALLATPIAARFVPGFPENAARDKSNGEIPHRPWLTLLRQRAFVRVTLVASLVLGRSCDVRFLCRDPLDAGRHQPRNHWRAVGGVGRRRGAGPSIPGPKIVASDYADCRIGGVGILRLMSWAVLAQTADVTALGLVQPLHGFTFALLHLASMRIRRRRWDRRFDAALRMALCPFRTSRFLGDGSTLYCRLPGHLATASGACSF